MFDPAKCWHFKVPRLIMAISQRETKISTATLRAGVDEEDRGETCMVSGSTTAKAGDLVLQGIDSSPAANPEIWERIVRMLPIFPYWIAALILTRL